jgi:diguanylate cyclase (GGDEF)-like protein/PAS domain S-box-containing protein
MSNETAADSKYRRIHEGMGDAFVLTDLQGRILEWNAAFADMTGHSEEELRAATIGRLTPEKWHEPEARIIDQQVMPQGRSRLYEKELVRRDGTVFPVELRTHLLRDARGLPEALWALIRDISERKRVEAALREQEDFFRLVAENSGDFIAVLDLNGRRLYSSPSYQRFFGDTRYLTGTDSFLEIHPDDKEQVRRVFAETVRTGVGQRTEFRFILPDGGVRHMESRGGVIRDESGRPSRVVVVSNDITARKLAEEQIYHLAFYDALTHLPNRRMLNDRLQQAMAASRRSGRYGALIFIDLDDFKPINDEYGHGLGDQLLIQTAARISGCVREVDTVARFGGDEFVVLVNDLDTNKVESMSNARMVAEKIRVKLAEPYALTVRHEDGSEAVVDRMCTGSIGVVVFRNHELGDEDLLRWADIAMYQAKESGGNQCRLVDPKDSTAAATRA